MSLLGLQSAVAAIIRSPRRTYDWNPEFFLKDFELAPDERKIVLKLSRHEELNKYGKDQAKGRWEIMLRHCDRVPFFVPDRVLRNIWFDLFEPRHLYAKSDLGGYFESSLLFLEFLQTDKDARKRLKRSAPFFIFDIIAFEIAELELVRPLLQDPPLHAKSVLTHPHFRIVELTFDIPALITDPDIENRPEFERPLSLVFVRDPQEMGPRIYEITSPMRAFLKDQLADAQANPPTEAMQADLVTMRLMQA